MVAMAGCATDVGTDTETHPAVAAHATAARASISSLRSLVASAGPRSQGFASVAEVDQSDVAEPFPLLLLGIADLRGYESGTNGEAMLRDVNEWFYPVVVSGQVRTAVRMGLRNGAWEPGVFGYAKVAQAAVAVREQLRATGYSGDLALVHVPALSLWLVSHRDHGTLMLTALRSDDAEGLVAGRPEPATSALTKVAGMARRQGT
jgi:hypothetical protein